MLLPSALSCDARPPAARSRFPSRLFPATPPPSDADGLIAGTALFGTCRALQSLLNASPAASPRAAKPARLQSPLHMRPQAVTRVAKPAAKPPRGANKRRRTVYEEEEHDNSGSSSDEDREQRLDRFSTPKRQRRAPPDLPLGLDLSDFRSLDPPPPNDDEPTSLAPPPQQQSSQQQSQQQQEQEQQQQQQQPLLLLPLHPKPTTTHPPHPQNLAATTTTVASDPLDPSPDWTSEDDGRLVDLVLEKLKLSKRDWNDCARKMGKDHDSVGRRWKALVGEGNVGLRRGKRMVRSRIHENWR
ncbi:hypothetical protein LOZ58_000866 [Ophidiomyces ophidiicola]|nr:hypothetical protein LOZ58_000866 [Ophidiomyces ophidiicola]